MGGVGADDPARRGAAHASISRAVSIACWQSPRVAASSAKVSPAGPGQQVVAVVGAEREPLVDQLLGLLPAAGVEGVLAEQEQRLDGGGDRSPFPAVLDGALQRLAARRQPVQVSDGDAGAGDASRADLLAEFGHGGVDLGRAWPG